MVNKDEYITPSPIGDFIMASCHDKVVGGEPFMHSPAEDFIPG